MRRGQPTRRGGGTGKAIGCGTLMLFAPILSAVAIVMLIVTLIFAGAGNVSGWIFGGGEPQNQPSANNPPNGETNLWTPTVIPDSCFVTPTPVGVVVQPPVSPATPPPPTNTPFTQYLPTPTACSLSFFATPDPNFPPIGAPGSGSFDIRHGTVSLATVQNAMAARFYLSRPMLKDLLTTSSALASMPPLPKPGHSGKAAAVQRASAPPPLSATTLFGHRAVIVPRIIP